MSFISIGILDIIDIFLVAYLLYQAYLLIKGTVAINIFIGIFSVYLIWLLVIALNMQLLSSILGQFMGVGVIALIIVFQQEIRNFLILIGTKYFSNKNFSLERLFAIFIKKITPKIKIDSIVKACKNMAESKTGALIVIARDSKLYSYAESGDILNANTSSRLIETIFAKNTPLHDGAVIIISEKVNAARCVLPISRDQSLPKNLGLRHRAALGISEITDAFVVVVSEETGHISCAQTGRITTNISVKELKRLLEKEFTSAKEDKQDVNQLKKQIKHALPAS